ncbi:MAG TPA: DUF3325 domain-containing protein [Cellvibrio sp.]
MLVAILLSYVGFAVLALIKNRHLHQIWPGRELRENTRSKLDALGWILLAWAGIYLIYQSGFGNGLVEYFASLTVAALIVVLQFSYWPRSILAIAVIERAGLIKR